MTQAMLADQLGVHAVTLGRWERGEVVPKKRFWAALQELLASSRGCAVMDSTHKQNRYRRKQSRL